MATALIADCSKSGVVMTSEIVKDKLTGIRVITTGTGAGCLEIAKKEKPSIILVDFDLPDADGPSLVRTLRSFYHGPILMTAFPDDNVKALAAQELCFFDDANEWLTKPINAIKLEAQLDKFLVQHHRVMRRFSVDFPAVISAKTIGARKSQEVAVACVNISLSGLLLKIEDMANIKKNTQITISLPDSLKEAPKIVKKKTSKAAKKTATAKKENKKSSGPSVHKGAVTLEAKIAWKNDELAGFTFKNVTATQAEKLENLLRNLANG